MTRTLSEPVSSTLNSFSSLSARPSTSSSSRRESSLACRTSSSSSPFFTRLEDHLSSSNLSSSNQHNNSSSSLNLHQTDNMQMVSSSSLNRYTSDSHYIKMKSKNLKKHQNTMIKKKSTPIQNNNNNCRNSSLNHGNNNELDSLPRPYSPWRISSVIATGNNNHRNTNIIGNQNDEGTTLTASKTTVTSTSTTAISNNNNDRFDTTSHLIRERERDNAIKPLSAIRLPPTLLRNALTDVATTSKKKTGKKLPSRSSSSSSTASLSPKKKHVSRSPSDSFIISNKPQLLPLKEYDDEEDEIRHQPSSISRLARRHLSRLTPSPLNQNMVNKMKKKKYFSSSTIGFHPTTNHIHKDDNDDEFLDDDDDHSDTNSDDGISEPCSYSNATFVASDIWLTQRDVQPAEEALLEKDLRRKRLQQRLAQLSIVQENQSYDDVRNSDHITTKKFHQLLQEQTSSKSNNQRPYSSCSSPPSTCPSPLPNSRLLACSSSSIKHNQWTSAATTVQSSSTSLNHREKNPSRRRASAIITKSTPATTSFVSPITTSSSSTTKTQTVDSNITVDYKDVRQNERNSNLNNSRDYYEDIDTFQPSSFSNSKYEPKALSRRHKQLQRFHQRKYADEYENINNNGLVDQVDPNINDDQNTTSLDDESPSSLLVSQFFSGAVVGSGLLQHHQSDRGLTHSDGHLSRRARRLAFHHQQQHHHYNQKFNDLSQPLRQTNYAGQFVHGSALAAAAAAEQGDRRKASRVRRIGWWFRRVSHRLSRLEQDQT